MSLEVTPRIAVVISTYNRARFLQRALCSVLNQTRQDWRCYVVGDHCTDRTEELMYQLMGKYGSRFIWDNLSSRTGPLHNNTGARVKEIAAARTTEPFLAFLDDDNEWFPRHLQILMSAYEKNQRAKTRLGLVWSDMNFYRTRDGAFIRQHRSSGPPREGSIDTSEMLVTRDAYRTAGGWGADFPPADGPYSKKRCDDFLFADRVVRAGYGWVHVPEVTVKYWDRNPHRVAAEASSTPRFRRHRILDVSEFPTISNLTED